MTAKHAADRIFVNDKEEIKHLYDVGRTLQNEFNPKRRHDSFYEFQTASSFGVVLHCGSFLLTQPNPTENT